MTNPKPILLASGFGRLSEHTQYWNFSSSGPKWPIILQNLNAAIAVVIVTLPVSVTLCLSINFFVPPKSQISPALGVVTNIIAMILSYIFGGPSNLFKSFSGTIKE